jgi:DNA-binding protein WhiA
MSYSFDVKEDILKFNTEASQHLLELQALLRFSGEVIISNPLKLSFTSTNMQVIRYFITLVKQFYTDVEYVLTSRQQQKLNKQTFYSCVIYNCAKTIIEDLGILDPVPYNKEEIMDNPNLIVAYLRGAFLAKGSVNDPVTSNYHLEIVTDKESEALFIQRIMNYYEINARIAKRKNSLIVYIKEKDTIIDFLRRLGANVTMNEFENIVIKRSLAADVNRLLNIDVANQQKTNNAAKEQLKYIKYIEMNFQLEKLDPKLLMVMKVRKDNPEASLNELVEIINEIYEDNITKSGLNHRFRKLKELALDFEARK